jgi:hypothetical protein
VQVDLVIQATQADQRNVVLTAPRLTLLQLPALVDQRRRGDRVRVEPGARDGRQARCRSSPVISNLLEGFVLDIEACIWGDRRYVTMVTGPVRPEPEREVHLRQR